MNNQLPLIYRSAKIVHLALLAQHLVQQALTLVCHVEWARIAIIQVATVRQHVQRAHLVYFQLQLVPLQIYVCHAAEVVIASTVSFHHAQMAHSWQKQANHQYPSV